MAFQYIPPIDDPQTYLDIAFKEAEKVANLKKIKGNIITKRRKTEIKRIAVSKKVLIGLLDGIITKFPTFDNLSIFYQELIDLMIGKVELKKNLATLSWINKKLEELGSLNINNIDKCGDIKKITQFRREYYGRISSIMGKKKKVFKFLQEARKKMRKFPTIKEIPTICIVGYPNVGKSTILTKLTTANPEINIYPFTTKGLMIGYIGKKLQLIDTPGAFREEISKMNYIEKQAYLALKYLAEKIVYVFDLSESCGYTIEKQEKLFKFIDSKIKKPKIIYLSKTDLFDEEKIREFRKKYSKFKVISEFKLLQKELKKH